MAVLGSCVGVRAPCPRRSLRGRSAVVARVFGVARGLALGGADVGVVAAVLGVRACRVAQLRARRRRHWRGGERRRWAGRGRVGECRAQSVRRARVSVARRRCGLHARPDSSIASVRSCTCAALAAGPCGCAAAWRSLTSAACSERPSASGSCVPATPAAPAKSARDARGSARSAASASSSSATEAPATARVSKTADLPPEKPEGCGGGSGDSAEVRTRGEAPDDTHAARGHDTTRHIL